MTFTTRKDHDKLVEEGRMKDEEIAKKIKEMAVVEEVKTLNIKQAMFVRNMMNDHEYERKKWAEEKKRLEKELKIMERFKDAIIETTEKERNMWSDRTKEVIDEKKELEEQIKFLGDLALIGFKTYKKDLNEKFISIATPVYQKYKYDKNCLRNYVIKRKDFIKFVNLIEKEMPDNKRI
jgi:hypothetical protein